MAKKSNHYIDNKRFEEVIFLFQEDQKAHEDELVEMFDVLITSICDSFRFKVDKEDAKQICFLRVLNTLPRFNKEKGSAFNYFTTVIINELKLVYTKNKKYNEKISMFWELKSGYSSSSV